MLTASSVSGDFCWLIYEDYYYFKFVCGNKRALYQEKWSTLKVVCTLAKTKGGAIYVGLWVVFFSIKQCKNSKTILCVSSFLHLTLS